MIPFDLEAAKAGAPVCTRSGQKVVILDFNLRGPRPIVAKLPYKDIDQVLSYFADGRLEKRYVPTEQMGKELLVADRKEDLMMRYDNNDRWLHPSATQAKINRFLKRFKK